MVLFQDFRDKKTEEILFEMNEGKMGKTTDVPFHVAKSLIDTRIVNQICSTIDEAKKDSARIIDNLIGSIDNFRKSNERTSTRLVYLTYVIAFAAIVQAVYAVIFIFKK